MKATLHLLAGLSLAFAGCSSTTMTVDSFNGRTGLSSRKVYSKYYDAAGWLVPKHLGMSVVVDHEKTRIPVVSGVQRSLGALGSGDAYAMGKVTIYLWNFDDQAHPITILRVVSLDKTVTLRQGGMTALPHRKTGGVVARFRIADSGTSMPIKIEYELNGKRSTIDFILARRTEEELARYFGPNGRPPYPWPWYGGKDELR
ncbi:MAG TPA: hypothetical protein VGO11_15485 [Chthoniobacteraceae bacterium]|jgi:hypothetical protein|nr:hypothetical protein [Chthoniobacteraceae bacterium]